MYEQLKRQVWNILKDFRNGLFHLEGTAMLCGYLAVKRGLDFEICKCAGLLHDVWLYLNMPCPLDMHGKHGYLGSELAREIISENGGYSEEDTEIICRMIYNHNDKHTVHDEYSEVLKDADALQHYLNNSDYDKKYNYHGRLEKLL